MSNLEGAGKSIPMLPVNGDSKPEECNKNGVHLDVEATKPSDLEKEIIIEQDRKYVPRVMEAEWSDDDDDDDITRQGKMNIIAKIVLEIQKWTKRAFELLLKITGGHIFTVIFLLGYIAYFITAMCYEFGSEGSHRLLGCTIVGFLILIRGVIGSCCQWIIRRIYGSKTLKVEHEPMFEKFRFFSRWLLYGAVLAIIAWMLIDEGRKKPKNLRSLPGLFIFLLIPLLFSTRPDKIRWHTIFWSTGLQFMCAAFVLKWHYGKECILWLQDRFNEFFANSEAASEYLFGPTWKDHYLMFGALPILFYSNATLAVLYYLGVMGFIIRSIGKALNYFLETTPVEATCVSTGIFMEGATTILLVGPFLKTLTKSQLFIVLTCTLSSLGGAYIAVLATLGVSLEYVIPAMLVSAPATFAVCKLILPETQDTERSSGEDIDVCAEEQKRYLNVMDAVQSGAIFMLSVVGNLAVVAYAFFAYISFINHTLGWFGDRVGVDDLSIEYISGYLLYPVALAMGIDPEDCRRVAMLLGYRIGIFNLVAFVELAKMKLNKFKYLQYMVATNRTGLVTEDDNDIILNMWNETLKNGFISDRSEAVVTYSLCGLSSFLSLVMNLGILYTLLPKRRVWLAKMAIPALIAGNLANCMTGCFASIFY